MSAINGIRLQNAVEYCEGAGSSFSSNDKIKHISWNVFSGKEQNPRSTLRNYAWDKVEGSFWTKALSYLFDSYLFELLTLIPKTLGRTSAKHDDAVERNKQSRTATSTRTTSGPGIRAARAAESLEKPSDKHDDAVKRRTGTTAAAPRKEHPQNTLERLISKGIAVNPYYRE